MYKNLYIILAGAILALSVFTLTFSGSARNRADFVFNNGNEPQTLDPQIMSGQPEGAIAVGIHEGLTGYHPKTLAPIPGVAERWEIDGLNYTFHLRPDSYWIKQGEIFTVDGKKRNVTAHDFIYSWRRMLHPETGSEYSFLVYFIEGCQQYENDITKHFRATIEKYDKLYTEIEVLGPESFGDEKYKDAREKFLKELNDYRDQRWKEVVKIEAPDPLTLKVQLRAITPFFLEITSYYSLNPSPREIVEKYGKFWTQKDNIVTNGPYYIDEWKFNSYIRLRKNKHYWETEEYVKKHLGEIRAIPDEKRTRVERDLFEYYENAGAFIPNGFETIDIRAVEEQITGMNLYINGDVDRIRELPTAILGELHAYRQKHGAESLPHLFTGTYNSVYYYSLLTTLPVFSAGENGELGRKLRRALSLSVDRKTLIRLVTRGGQRPAYRLCPPGISGYSEMPCFGSGDYETDLAEAKKLVEEVRAAGVKIPKLKVLYNTHEAHEKVAVYIQSLWKNHLGIEIELANQEWGVYLDSRRTGNFEVCRAGWIGDYKDPNTFLDMWVIGNQNNDPKYNNPQYTKIINEYCAYLSKYIATEEDRNKLLADIRNLRDYEIGIKNTPRPNGKTLDASFEEALTLYGQLPKEEQMQQLFKIRLLLFEIAEQVMLWDMPLIPLYFYTTTQFWPPELEGMYINSKDFHPMKQMRWKDGKRPTGTRYHAFPRLDN